MVKGHAEAAKLPQVLYSCRSDGNTVLGTMELGAGWVEAGLWGLFVASFLAATILPLGSEAVLAVMALGPWGTAPLWLVATTGNTLGGMTTYALGRWGDLERVARWLRADPAKAWRWKDTIQQYGAVAALLAWLPLVGDAIALMLGMARAPRGPVLWYMLLGKAARYAVILWLLHAGPGG